ncbi:MAG: hypothetical protein A2Y40_02565 [Candidatus Margulisbacteria bacterium GWF2_35_9]|nr:MAG: hypothetical protein A2Y40_02565 [Candidatus Margulisbacteria bacterium GWF2_35_9]
MNLGKELTELKIQHLYRSRKIVEDTKYFPMININDRELINFASNNYLALGESINEEVLGNLLTNGIVQQASPLISGYTKWHKELEEKLARMKGRESALLFSSGFTANLATITTLCTEKDLIIIDKLSHASIMEATKYRHINYRVFPHLNYEYLIKMLQAHRSEYEDVYIVTDSLFSMDGDKANLRKIREIAERFNAYMIVDDAHATGVYGENGSGLVNRKEVVDYKKLIVTGTLSKALQSYGGFVAADCQIIEYLVNKAKPYIYNTALPLVHVFSGLKALELFSTKQNQTKLWKNIVYFSNTMNSHYNIELSPIIPIVIGDNEKVQLMSQKLWEDGFFVPAIRYPTVPKKKAMLRISLSAGHQQTHLESLAQAIKRHI